MGVSVGKNLIDFTQSLKDAPDELRDLAKEFRLLSGKLIELQQVKEGGLLEDVNVKSLCEHGAASLREV